MICEDPASTPALYGALLTMEEFLESEEGSQYVKVFKKGQYFLVKWGRKKKVEALECAWGGATSMTE